MATSSVRIFRTPCSVRLILEILGATIGVLLSSTITYVASPVYASEIAPVAITETLEAQVTRIAEAHKTASTTLLSLVMNESNGSTTVVGKTGDRGITQISPKWHPEVSDECAFDSECALNWTAQLLADGKEYEYVVCNCYAYLKVKYLPNLPKMADITPNSGADVGKVAVLTYGDVKHVGYITKLDAGGFWINDANFKPCDVQTHFIKWDDPHLRGYWEPSKSP